MPPEDKTADPKTRQAKFDAELEERTVEALDRYVRTRNTGMDCLLIGDLIRLADAYEELVLTPSLEVALSARVRAEPTPEQIEAAAKAGFKAMVLRQSGYDEEAAERGWNVHLSEFLKDGHRASAAAAIAAYRKAIGT